MSMATNALTTYLQDHLAGSVAAIEILDALRDQQAHGSIGSFAAAILEEVERDRETLESLIKRMGGGASAVKETTAWIGARFKRLRMRHSLSEDFGALEALEIIALGILGKKALWDALAALRDMDGPLGELDLEQLMERANTQHALVEARRVEMARKVLGAAGREVETR